MLTRANESVTVVSAPTMSNSPARRASCSAQAESLPLDQATNAFGRAVIGGLFELSTWYPNPCCRRIRVPQAALNRNCHG